MIRNIIHNMKDIMHNVTHPVRRKVLTMWLRRRWNNFKEFLPNNKAVALYNLATVTTVVAAVGLIVESLTVVAAAGLTFALPLLGVCSYSLGRWVRNRPERRRNRKRSHIRRKAVRHHHKLVALVGTSDEFTLDDAVEYANRYADADQNTQQQMDDALNRAAHAASTLHKTRLRQQTIVRSHQLHGDDQRHLDRLQSVLKAGSDVDWTPVERHIDEQAAVEAALLRDHDDLAKAVVHLKETEGTYDQLLADHRTVCISNCHKWCKDGNCRLPERHTTCEAVFAAREQRNALNHAVREVARRVFREDSAAIKVAHHLDQLTERAEQKAASVEEVGSCDNTAAQDVVTEISGRRQSTAA